MFTVVGREDLAPDVVLLEVEAPLVARKARAGQFVILRLDEPGERVPLTIADADPARGTVTIVFLVVGRTTAQLADLRPGDRLADFAGPLGKPTHIERFGTVVLVGGGLGIAPLYPIARAMKEAGNEVVTILGARTRERLFFLERMGSVSDRMLLATDDGSAGTKGFVTTVLEREVAAGLTPDLVVGIGPVIMMKVLCDATRALALRTVVSLNPVMVDGTGMCGACRVTVGGATRFVCVDGPDFDGHLVDFAELTARNRSYCDDEKRALERYRGRCSGGCRR